MNRLEITPQWRFQGQDPKLQQQMPLLLALLASIHDQGSLQRACVAADVSYRYAWGLLRDATRLFGVPLVHFSRGQGATLTTIGERLVWADRRIRARLSPVLEGLAVELAAELERARADARTPVRLHASHGYAIVALRDAMAAQEIPVELQFRTSVEAYASMDRGTCDVAGFHVATGELEAATLEPFRRLFKPDSHALIALTTRRQGLMVTRGNPASVLAVQDLARAHVRFVNRQAGSGTRALLDALLARDGIDSRAIAGYEVSELTHDAVAAYVASGMADAGFGIEPAARQFGLDFVPLVTERYFLACRTSALGTEPVRRAVAILRSHAFRAHLNDRRGLDSIDAGTLLSLTEAFPVLAG
ncbi:MAG: helix-turn-helix transcriptional regulator [Proteobacteria bacterium]|nr:helix-turn-helix transcriptional regulator [Pseudomonadota bacterium]